MPDYSSILQKAIRRGFLSPEQAQKCTEDIRRAMSRGENTSWQSFMVKNDYISVAQLKVLIASLEKEATTSPGLNSKDIDTATDGFSPSRRSEAKAQSALDNRAEPNTTRPQVESRLSTKMMGVLGIQVGATIGPFTILKLLGKGGMGVVYQAQQKSLNRLVALKIMTKLGTKDSPQIRRFLREVQLNAKLDHPNIIKTYMAGIENDVPYLAMSYVDGMVLKQYLETCHPSMEETLKLFVNIAKALHHAHEQGIIHRDIKPSNIMVTRDGIPIVMDFGIARSTRVHDRRLTQTGEIVGTPQYMAFEQAKGMRDIDGRVDIYSLGVVLYEVLTGRALFASENTLETLYQMINSSPVSPHTLNPEISPGLEAIILKCLEKNRNNRYDSAQELAEDIERYLQGQPLLALGQVFSQKNEQRYRSRRLRWLLMSASLILICLIVTLAVTIFRIKRTHETPLEPHEKYDRYIAVLEQQGKYGLAMEKLDEAIKWASEEKREFQIVFKLKKSNLLLKMLKHRENIELCTEILDETDDVGHKLTAELNKLESHCCLRDYKRAWNIFKNQLPSQLPQKFYFYCGATSFYHFLDSVDRDQYLEKMKNKKFIDHVDIKTALDLLHKAYSEPIVPQASKTTRMETCVYLGYIYICQGDWKQALQYLEKSKNSSSKWLLREEAYGILHYCKEEYQKAAEYFQECGKISPGDSHYYRFRARSNLQLPDIPLQEILDDCSKSLEVLPVNLTPFHIMFEALFKNPQIPEFRNSQSLLMAYINKLLESSEPELWAPEYQEMAESCMKDSQSSDMLQKTKRELARYILGRDGSVLIQAHEKHEEYFKILSEILDTESPLWRFWSAQMLVALRTPESISILKRGCDSENLVTNSICTAALARAQFPIPDFPEEKLKKLQDKAKKSHDKSQAEEQALAILLHHVGEKFSDASLRQFTGTEYDDKIKCTAAKALLRRGDKGAIQVLAAHFGHHREEIKAYSYWWFWEPNFAAFPQIRQELLGSCYLEKIGKAFDESAYVKRIAIISLHRLYKKLPNDAKPDMKIVEESLVKALEKERDISVRFLILLTLSELGRTEEVTKAMMNTEETLVNRVMPLLFQFFNSTDTYANFQLPLWRALQELFKRPFKPITDPDPMFCALCLRLLGEAGGVSNIPAINKLIDPYVFDGLQFYFGVREEYMKIAAAQAALFIQGNESSDRQQRILDLTKSLQEKIAEEGYHSQFALALVTAYIYHLYYLAYDSNIISTAIEEEQFSKLMSSPSLAQKKAAAYGYYHFIDKIYREEVDNRLLDATTRWGRDQNYVLHLEASSIWIYRSVVDNRVRLLTPLRVRSMRKELTELMEKLDCKNVQELWEQTKKAIRHGTCKLKPQVANAESLVLQAHIAREILKILRPIERARALDEKNSQYHFVASFLLESLGEREKAREAIKRSLGNEPLRHIYQLSKARLLYKLGDLEEARGIIDALRKSGFISYALLEVEGKIYLAKKEYELAEKTFEHMHILAPFLPEPLILRGHSRLWLKKDIEAAEDDLTKGYNLILQEQQRAECLYRGKGEFFFPKVYIDRAIGNYYYGMARLAAIRHYDEKATSYCQQGVEVLHPLHPFYSQTPFTQKNLQQHPEFANILNTPFILGLPNAIKGLTCE